MPRQLEKSSVVYLYSRDRDATVPGGKNPVGFFFIL
jgi:hypothetical protein